MNSITTSVGAGGSNSKRDDIRLVQTLLNNHVRPPYALLPEDGVVTPVMVDAIRRFQSEVVKLPMPDGRVDPGGRTIRALLAAPGGAPAQDRVAVPPPVNATGSFSTQEQIDAIKKAYGHVFLQGEGKGLCAKWTYNLAYSYARSLRGQELHTGSLLAAGGNANGAGYHSNLAQLGYTKSVVSEDATKATVKKLIGEMMYNVGDVLVYWALEDDAGVAKDGKASDGHWMYGHTQIFTGQHCLPQYFWACDQKNNYGCTFVYGNADRYPGDRWKLMVFRAPAA